MTQEFPADFKVRMPPDVKARLEVAARENNRSLNKEIVARLEQTLDVDGDARSALAAKRLLQAKVGIDPLEKRIEELEARVAKLEK